MSHPPSHPGERRIHAFQIKLIDEVTAGPVDVLSVLFVSRIENDFQELLVPANTAYIFRWATALTDETNGMLQWVVPWQDLLQYDLVFPVVTEVVLVDY